MRNPNVSMDVSYEILITCNFTDENTPDGKPVG